MELVDFSLNRLHRDTILKPFNCIDADLNGFLIDDAHNYSEELMAVTYLIESNESIAAYFSLFNDKVSWDSNSNNVWNRLTRKIPNKKRRKHYPAVKIGRIAVSKQFERNGLGTKILSLVKYMFTENNRTGCRFITVDAYSAALLFYEKNGFDYLTDTDAGQDTRLMYYDLKKFI